MPGEAQFTSLPGAFPGLVTAIQAVDDEPRYHVDIETDDVAAETARLVALGRSSSAGGLTAVSSGRRAATSFASFRCTATLTPSTGSHASGTSEVRSALLRAW